MPSSRKATTRISGSWIEPGPWAAGLACAIAAMWWVSGGGPAVLRQAVAAEQAVEPDQVAVFMRAKLAHSQDVLEGLSLADFGLIAKGAQELSLASQASSWQVLQTEDYARHSAEFRRSCDTLRRAASEENLDGALVAWMEVTMKCVQCHRYVRDTRK
jgi:hypothetical protein